MRVGYGVWDVLTYANSFNYFDNKIKDWTNINHGNANLKIGKYNTRARINESNKYKLYLDRNILKNTKSIITNNENDIFNEIKKNYCNFNKKNYEIRKPVGGILTKMLIQEK